MTLKNPPEHYENSRDDHRSHETKHEHVEWLCLQRIDREEHRCEEEQ